MEALSSLLNYVAENGIAFVMCILLYIKVNEQDKTHHEDLLRFSDSLEKNTQAITEMRETLRNLGGNK